MQPDRYPTGSTATQPCPDRDISIILPAKNESRGLQGILPRIARLLPDAELIVVDSGSTDDTARVARDSGARVVKQPYAYGNGAAVKAGIRAAQGRHLVLMDADGQHAPEDIPRLLETYRQGYDMVVGARESDSHASTGRRIANAFYNRFASWITGHRIEDLTSGFRVVRADLAREFLHLLPNGFSYPTTLTMALFRSGLSVGYRRIRALDREGESHINPVRDGLRFLVIIFKVATLYSPLKIFVPVSALHFATAAGYYTYTYLTQGRLTNLTVILTSVGSLVFLIGLLSEQITTLLYSLRQASRRDGDDG